MIDWPGVGLAALWIIGLAVVLATLCHAGYVGRIQDRRFRASWSLHHTIVAETGAFAVALSLVFTSRTTWETGVAALCAAAIGLQTFLDARRLRRDDQPDAGVSASAQRGLPSARTTRAARWLLGAELPITAALSLVLVLLPDKARWALPAVLAIWIARWIALRRPTHPTPVDGAMLVLLVQLGVSLFVSADYGLTWTAANQLLGGLLLFYALVNWVDRPARLRLALAGGIVLGLALSAPPILARLHQTNGKVIRLAGLNIQGKGILSEDINANVLAGNLALIVPLALAGMDHGRRRPAPRSPRGARAAFAPRAGGLLVRLACLLAAGTMLLALVLSQSRGALVAVTAGVLVYGLLQFRWFRWALPAALLILSIAVGVAGPSRLYHAVVTPDLADVFARRAEIWSRALYASQDFSFTGIGIGTFVRVIPILYPYFLHGPDAQIGHAHNLFLQVAVDLGIPGLIAYLSILMAAFWAAWRLCRNASAGWSTLGVAFFASNVVLVTHGLVDAVTWGTKPAPIQWLVIGLTFAALPLSHERNPSAAEFPRTQDGGGPSPIAKQCVDPSPTASCSPLRFNPSQTCRRDEVSSH